MDAAQTLADVLDAPAAEWRDALARANLRLSPHGRVHAVAHRTWIGGIRIPVARCGASTPGGPFDGYAATPEPVSCASCGALAAAAAPRWPTLPLASLWP